MPKYKLGFLYAFCASAPHLLAAVELILNEARCTLSNGIVMLEIDTGKRSISVMAAAMDARRFTPRLATPGCVWKPTRPAVATRLW